MRSVNLHSVETGQNVETKPGSQHDQVICGEKPRKSRPSESRRHVTMTTNNTLTTVTMGTALDRSFRYCYFSLTYTYSLYELPTKLKSATATDLRRPAFHN